MKSLIKQLSLLSVAGVLTLCLIGFVIPFLGKMLSIYEFTDVLIENKSIIILLSILTNYLIGLYFGFSSIFNKIRWIHVLTIFSFLYLGIALINYSSYSNTWFELEISLIVGVVLGYLTSRKKVINKKIMFTLISVVFFISTWKYTIPLSNQKKLYGNYSGLSDFRKLDDVRIFNSNKEPTLIDFKNIIVIDFWNNNCSICFKKFPEFKNLQKVHSKKDNITFITINIISDFDEIDKANQLLRETSNNDLNNYFMLDKDAKSFNVNWFPKIMVIESKKVVFEGTIETLKMFDTQFLDIEN